MNGKERDTMREKIETLVREHPELLYYHECFDYLVFPYLPENFILYGCTLLDMLFLSVPFPDEHLEYVYTEMLRIVS